VRTIASMSPSRGSLLALALLATGCAGGRLAARRESLPPPAPGIRTGSSPGAGPETGLPGPGPASGSRPARTAGSSIPRALETAASLLGATAIVVSGTDHGDGCDALVRAALAEGGIDVPAGDASALHAAAKARGGVRRGNARPGDLVFLSDRPGGPVEHVGLVERAGPDGTVVFLHRTARGVARLRLNAPNQWKARTEAGKALNDVLIVGAGRVTTGRLLVGYATPR
jgi:NlpC/P60 family protein